MCKGDILVCIGFLDCGLGLLVIGGEGFRISLLQEGV